MRNKKILQKWIDFFESKNHNSTKIKEYWNHLLTLDFKNKNARDISLDLLTKKFFFSKQKNIDSKKIEDMALKIKAIRLVYINGRFHSELSNKEDDAYQINILNAASFDFKEAICPDFFLYLTECFTEDITKILVPRNTLPKFPLYLFHISTGDNKKCLNFTNYRHHLNIQSEKQIQIIEHYVSLDDNATHFTGTRLTMDLEKNTKIMHTKIVCENSKSYHFAHNDIELKSDCQVHSQNFLLGAQLSRHKTSVKINGETSNIVVNSITLPLNKEISKTSTYFEHNKSYCHSRQLHKTITHDHGLSIFHGLIKVGKNIAKIDANMVNNNLLLGNFSKISSEPKLEIYSDDVKCSHGSTTGCIDDEQIFYLCSRGIDKILAKKIIIFAFFSSLTEKINDIFLKKIILNRIFKRLSEEK